MKRRGRGNQRENGRSLVRSGRVLVAPRVCGGSRAWQLAGAARQTCWRKQQTSRGPRHLALPAVHELVAVGKGLARPREEHLLAHLVAARQRLRAARAGSLGVDVASRGCIGRSALVGLRHAAEAEAEAWLWRAVRAYAWALA